MFVRIMIPDTKGARLTKPATISQIAIVRTFEGETILTGLFRSEYNMNSKTSKTISGAANMTPNKVHIQNVAATQFQIAETSRGVVMIVGALCVSTNPGWKGAETTLAVGSGTIVRWRHTGQT